MIWARASLGAKGTKTRFQLAIAMFAVIATPGLAIAASVFLTPSSPSRSINNGDFFAFDTFMAFTDQSTIGGGFDIEFDSSAVKLR